MLCSALLLIALVAPSPAQATSADWPHWRGPAGNGVSPEQGWLAEGAEQELWRREVGLGYSSPSIQGEFLYVMGYHEALEGDLLQALNVETGELLWSHRYPAELRDHEHGGGSLTSPTVAGQRLYVTHRDGGVRCYLARTGELLWYKNALRLYATGETYYGYSSSPVLIDDLLVFSMNKVIALDAQSGDTVWVSEPLDAQYSTPAPMRHQGEAALAVFSQQGLHVLDLATGAERAWFPWGKSDRLVNASTPIVMGERVFISSAYDNGCALVDFSGAEPQQLWRSSHLRTKMAGCVVLDGYVYGFDESVLMCLSLEDGSIQWRQRGLGNGALIAGDGKLVIVSSKGELIIAEATPIEFRELSSQRVIQDGGVFWTPPSLAGGRIFVRNDLGTLVARDHRAGARAATALAQDEGPAEPAALPLGADLFARHLAAIGGAAKLRAVRGMTLEGSFAMPVLGFPQVPMKLHRRAPNLWNLTFDVPGGRPGVIQRCFDGELGFELNAWLGNTLFSEEVTREFAETLGLQAEAQYAEIYAKLETLGRTSFDGRECFEVLATSKAGAERRFYFEVESGLLAGRRAEAERLVMFSDYREFEGLLLATTERSFGVDTGIEETLRIQAVRFELPGEALFQRPEEIEVLRQE